MMEVHRSPGLQKVGGQKTLLGMCIGTRICCRTSKISSTKLLKRKNIENDERITDVLVSVTDAV
jgi:hypothetical protein